jgi:hypothetical protein
MRNLSLIIALCTLVLAINASGQWTVSHNTNLNDETYQQLFGTALTTLASENTGFASADWKVTNILSVSS